ncbi:condensation domain-containing protein [Actinocrinis sp.]|uniref:condensation domain-containing protein n=1 Tax=Actinocrinis sp. TaxID=1920516 RepID=UPI002D5328B1|nr:condensation domain-containing protein [Actinocrinis sp.]HZP50522.1 condensation domain-containing protein [Actinocrinis sp.]
MGSAWPPVQTVLEISGFADVAALQRAVDTVFRAHPHLLRGFGRTAHGSLISVERRDAVPRLRAVDLREYPAGHREAAASRLEEHERCEEFALGAPPLVRLLLIRTGDRERRLAVTSHRLLLDDWSHAALIRAVLAAFRAGWGNEGTDRGTARQCTLDGRTAEPARTTLRAADQRLETDAHRGFDLAAPCGTEDPVRLTRELPRELTRRIELRAAELGVAAESVVHAAWAFALSRLTGRRDVVFGATVTVPRTGSSHDPTALDVTRAILPATVRVEAEGSPGDLLRAASRHTIDSAPRRRGDRTDPCWDAERRASDTVAVLEPEPIGPVMPRLGIRISTLSMFDAKPFPLSFSIVPGPSWIARVDFQPAALPARVARSGLGHAVAFLEAAAYAPDCRLDRIDDRRAVGVRSARAA